MTSATPLPSTTNGAATSSTALVLTGQAWHDRVADLAAQATAKFPQCESRINRAIALVLADAVTFLPDGTAHVASQRQGATVAYLVSETCDCEDFPQAPESLCTHRLAFMLAKRARQTARPGEAAAAQVASPPSSPRRTPATPPTAASLVEDAMAEAERICQAAMDATPVAYRGFVTFLPRRTKVGGSKEQPLYADLREPYLQVRGRLQMAIDEHRRCGAVLQIDTTFVEEPCSGHLLCRAHVTTVRGTVTAHARAVLNARSGVDSSHPLENAETSAVGRALGFLGYGLLGGGVASAEDVVRACDIGDASAVPSAEAEEPSVDQNTPPSRR